MEKLDENMNILYSESKDITWYTPKSGPLRVSGLAWFEEEKLYRRLPRKPHVEIPDAVDRLADCPAGGQIKFQTNAHKLIIRVKLTGKAYMSHMAATGQCGFDCYIGTDFCNVTRYELAEKEYTIDLFENRKGKDVIPITLNFPLYQGVEDVWIGVNKEAQVTPPSSYTDKKKVIFYGTSILQGGCASRPGLAYTNILSRSINLEFINLGFSGNGKGEANLARLISSIKDPACLVLDYEPNCESTMLYKSTLPEFIRIYRETHPHVPILVVSKFPYAGEIVNKQLYNDRVERLQFQRELIQELQEKGDSDITFMEGTDLLGAYGKEGTVDGIHPNDLGFMSMAEKLEPVLRDVIKRSGISL